MGMCPQQAGRTRRGSLCLDICSGTEGRREMMCPSVLPKLPTMGLTGATPSSSNGTVHARGYCRVIAGEVPALSCGRGHLLPWRGSSTSGRLGPGAGPCRDANHGQAGCFL